jgi:hypothetical protein
MSATFEETAKLMETFIELKRKTFFYRYAPSHGRSFLPDREQREKDVAMLSELAKKLSEIREEECADLSVGIVK